METFLYTVIPALYQFEGGPEAQVGDQVKLYLDTEAQPGFPEFVTGIIQHPIVRVCDGTQYAVEYDPADLDGAAELLVTGNVVSALVVTAVDLLRSEFESHNHDGRYYTEAEVNILLAAKVNISDNPIGDTAPVNPEPTGVLAFSGLTAPTYASEPLTKVVGVSEWTNDGSEFTVWTGNPAQKHLVKEGGIWRLYQDEVVIAESEDDGATNPWEPTWFTLGPGAGEPTPVPEMSEATPAPPFFRVAAGYFYVRDAGVWSKVAVSSF